MKLDKGFDQHCFAPTIVTIRIREPHAHIPTCFDKIRNTPKSQLNPVTSHKMLFSTKLLHLALIFYLFGRRSAATGSTTPLIRSLSYNEEVSEHLNRVLDATSTKWFLSKIEPFQQLVHCIRDCNGSVKRFRIG